LIQKKKQRLLLQVFNSKRLANRDGSDRKIDVSAVMAQKINLNEGKQAFVRDAFSVAITDLVL